MKKKIVFLLQGILILVLAACSAITVETEPVTASQTLTVNDAVATVNTTPLAVIYSDEDLNPGTEDVATSFIKLEGDTITLEGTGAIVNSNTVTITAAGVYEISGILDNGQIVVTSEDDATVTLILNGVDITNTTSAPIYIKSADKVVLTLADGTNNVVTDGTEYIFESAETDEPNAAIFSKDDLTINGTGSLIVNANYNNGIASKDGLKITSGTITVTAVNDGIKGKDYIAVKDGMITVNAGGDGLQSNNEEDAEKGYILIEGGTFIITSGMDGIQAETRLTINAGELDIVSGGGSIVTYELEESAKGLKAGVDVTIAGGTISIDSADDAIHSNNNVTIDGGDITVASGDDGVHADSTITMNNGSLIITKSYEGVEAATITINDGTIHLNADDDGINSSESTDDTTNTNTMGGPPQGFGTGNAHLNVNGGYIYVDANGDGIDINGAIDMTGGTVIVNGPVGNGDGPLDYDGYFNLTGGYLLAVGSSGMAQAPSNSSTQYAIQYNFDSQQAAGSLIHIETSDGEEVLTFAPTKAYQSVVLSSPELANGVTYVVYVGGGSTGIANDGLYSSGTYSMGTQITSFTISSIVTTVGAVGGMGGGNPGGFGPGGGGSGGGPGQGGPPSP